MQADRTQVVLTTETPAVRTRDIASAPQDREGILRQTLRLYREHFNVFIGTFLIPATAHFLWVELQRLQNHLRHPGWPQEGIILDPVHGNSVYSIALVLTCIGALVYLALFGPAIAAVYRVVSARIDPDPALGAQAAIQQPRFRALKVHLLATLRAWAVFLFALAGFVVVAATILESASEVGFDLWYLLLAIAIFVGFPVGVWMSVRTVLAVPAAICEFLRGSEACERSVLLTRGIRLRILGVLGLAAGLRWILGLAANVLFGMLARKYPAAATAEAFVMIPLLSFVLDLGIGPLFGIPIVLFYRRQARETVATAQ